MSNNKGLKSLQIGHDHVERQYSVPGGLRMTAIPPEEIKATSSSEQIVRKDNHRGGPDNDPSAIPSQVYPVLNQDEIIESYRRFTDEEYKLTNWYLTKDARGQHKIDRIKSACKFHNLLCLELHTVRNTRQEISFIHVYNHENKFCGHRFNCSPTKLETPDNDHYSCLIKRQLSDDNIKAIITRKYQLSNPNFNPLTNMKITRNGNSCTITYNCPHDHLVTVPLNRLFLHRCTSCRNKKRFTRNELIAVINAATTKRGIKLEAIIPQDLEFTTDTKLFFRCPNNHLKSMQISSYIYKGTDCDDCFQHRFTWTLKENRDGRCKKFRIVEIPGQTYHQNKLPMQFFCKRCKTIFDKPWTQILRGTTCTNCRGYKSELFSKHIIQFITGKEFRRMRPDFINNYELDGYCEELKMAMEFEGLHHFEYVPKFHNERPDYFAETQRRDIFKIQKCRELGIQLMCIPPEFNYTNPETIPYVIGRVLDSCYVKNYLIDTQYLKIHQFHKVFPETNIAEFQQQDWDDELMRNINLFYNYFITVECRMCDKFKGIKNTIECQQHFSAHYLRHMPDLYEEKDDYEYDSEPEDDFDETNVPKNINLPKPKKRTKQSKNNLETTEIIG